jgi:hypothetical protein
MKALGSRMGACTSRALLLVLFGACATRELPPNDPRSALSLDAAAGVTPEVTKSLDAEPGAGALETPTHSHHEQQHGGHHHGH